MKNLTVVTGFLLLTACSAVAPTESMPRIITTDIDHFWTAYDKITGTEDTIAQRRYLQELFLDKGSPGLDGIMRARNYTPEEYLQAIRDYPRFWASVRENTFKAKTMAGELKTGVDKLKALYPDLRPADIYFTIGALRTNGTVMDSMLLIGTELAMADENIATEEFSEPMDNRFRSTDIGPMGVEHVARVRRIDFSADGKSATYLLEGLEPDKQYQMVIAAGFRTKREGIPLIPYTIEFKTEDR